MVKRQRSSTGNRTQNGLTVAKSELPRQFKHTIIFFPDIKRKTSIIGDHQTKKVRKTGK